MCQLKLGMTAETEQHAVMSKTYCAREYSVKLAKYIIMYTESQDMQYQQRGDRYTQSQTCTLKSLSNFCDKER